MFIIYCFLPSIPLTIFRDYSPHHSGVKPAGLDSNSYTLGALMLTLDGIERMRLSAGHEPNVCVLDEISPCSFHFPSITHKPYSERQLSLTLGMIVVPSSWNFKVRSLVVCSWNLLPHPLQSAASIITLVRFNDAGIPSYTRCLT